MSDRLPHVRAPDGDPDVCVHCREEWVDLLTLYETDECSVRLRAEVERLRAEIDLLRTSREATRAYADRVEAEVLALRGERAAVVAWLEKAGWMPSMVEVFKRGEHRREETK